MGRGFSSANSVGLIVILAILYADEEKTRSNNLRFTSNLLFNLYKKVLDFPFKVGNPKVAAVISGGNTLLGFTHVGLVAHRWNTDNEDNVSFKII